MSEDTKWIDIMRVGEWTAQSGRKSRFDENVLDEIASRFNSEDRAVPLVLGHPETNDPAYGWVSKVRRVGGLLQAAFKQVPEAVKKMVAEGRYKNISISLYPNKALRHVGLLGAAQPAVSGLREVSFNDGDEFLTFEFPDGQATDFARTDLLRSRLEELEQKLSSTQEALAFERSEKEKMALEFSENGMRKEQEARNARVRGLCEKAHILPYEIGPVTAFAEGLCKGGETFQFSENEESMPLEEAFFQFLERRSHDLFKEVATPDRARSDTREGDERGYSFDKV